MIQPRNPDTAVAEINQLLEGGRHREAAARCRSLADAFPDHPGVLSAAGGAAFQAGDRRSAVAMLQRAERLDPGFAPASASLGRIFEALGRPGDAEAAFARALEAAPGDFEIRFAHAVALERLERHPAAEAEYRAVLGIRPELAPALLGVGNALRGQGRLDEARDAYHRAIALDPNLVSAYNNLGGVLQELGDCRAAEAAYRNVVTRSPNHADGWYNLGVCLRGMGRPEAAVVALRRAAEVSPSDARVLMYLGMVLQDVEAFDEALETYQRAIECVAPDERFRIDLMGKLHSSIVDVYIQRGNLDRALEECERYLAERPGDSSMLAVKAIVHNEQGHDAAVGALMDYQRLICTYWLDPPQGYETVDGFNRALAEHVLSHPSLRNSPQGHATRNGMHSGDLLAEPKGPIVALERAIWTTLDVHEQQLRESDPGHPFLVARPRGLALRMWGVVMRRQGHQIPHIHPAAWVSGCYYAAVPGFVAGARDSQAGWIEFARTPDWFHHRREVEPHAFAPEEGALFLFPAYLWHRTIPFDEEGVRISIAFDIVPAA